MHSRVVVHRAVRHVLRMASIKTEEVLQMAIKRKGKGLLGKVRKGYKGITAAAITVQIIAVALIIVVETVGLMKDRELDLGALGIKKDSKTKQQLQ